MRGEPVSTLHGQNGEIVDAEVSVDADGTGVVQTTKQQVRFEHAGLLSLDVEQRKQFLDESLASHTLAARYGSELQAIIAKVDFSNDDFLSVIQTLISSPESFAEQLHQKVTTQRIARDDLVPQDLRHWDNLLAPIEYSTSLSQFLNAELAEERRVHLASDPAQAMRLISLGFCAPGLVPLAMLRELDADKVLAMVESVADVEDHFALVGAFEICADWIQRDSRFGPIGERLLKRLFGDMPRLRTSCGMFASAFIIEVAHLARHETLRCKPAFWRRLAAAAQASLVVRPSGPADIDEVKLMSWAMFVAAKPYFLSVYLDMSEEPRWRPDWIYPDFLIADAIGRVRGAVVNLPDGVAPSEWKNRSVAAQNWLADQKIEPLAIFPAIGECERRPQEPTLAALDGDLADIYSEFASQPTIDQFVRLTPIIFTFGFPTDLSDSLLTVLASIRSDASTLGDKNVQLALATAAHIASQQRNASIADTVANICLEKATSIADTWTALEVMFRLVECAATDPNKSGAISVLTRRLENLAFILPESTLPQFLDGIEALQSLDSNLAMDLGKVRAATRLGITPDAA